jgi:PAS domain S-box-containing protein
MRYAARRRSTARLQQRRTGRRASARLFGKYAVISLVPVLALGVALAVSWSSEAHQRGLSEGRSEALLVAQTAVQPLLDPGAITAHLSAEEKTGLTRLVAAAVHNHKILRLRVRDLAGHVVFSDDGSGLGSSPEGEALTAARGGTVARLTRLNADSNDTGASGPAAVEVYQPLYARGSPRRVGVLEMYLPYAAIAADVTAGLHRLYLNLAIGLTLLYLALFAITASVSRGLRRQLSLNASQAEQLRESEEQHRLLFERNPQPMLAYDRATLRIVAVSNATIATYGYSREEFLAMTIKDLGPREDVETLERYLKQLLNKRSRGLVVAHPWRHQYKDGTVVDVEITSDDLVLGGVECRLTLCQNVTERNKASAELAIARDEAVEASNMKSAFLANMSHEIRTPMNGVIGMNELLLETELSDEQRAYADQVARSGEQMMMIINDVLDVSKIEAGQLELDVTDFALPEVVEQACAVARSEAQAKGLALGLHFAKAVPERARGDGRRLRQAVLNLVANAVKFTAEGSVDVRVTAAPRPGGVARIRVEIADTGIGIAPDALDRMFEPFTQADASTTRPYGGTGLGLAISRELIDLMGGTIGAESEPGRGSTFWLELDLSAPLTGDGPPAHSNEPKTVPARLGSAAPLVLVAEDSPVNQIVAVRALERCGCRAQVAADGREALQALGARRYDAVLMDCQMPGMDGYQATAELRKREQGDDHTPVIAMTAFAMKGDLEKCLAAGMDDYISKPMRYQALVDTLRRWVPVLSEPTAQPDVNGGPPVTGSPRPALREHSLRR